jgi:sulfide dehydrogenase cytochrome subunit
MIRRAALAALLFVPPGAQTCSSCHGPGGLASLAGQEEAGLRAALTAFRDGTRPATIMDRIARGFSPDEIAAFARYWAAQR